MNNPEKKTNYPLIIISFALIICILISFVSKNFILGLICAFVIGVSFGVMISSSRKK